jgi:hypothetical protein
MIYLIHHQDHISDEPEASLLSRDKSFGRIRFLFDWLFKDKLNNTPAAIHIYYYFTSKLKMLGMKSSNFYKLKEIISKCDEKQDERITVGDDNLIRLNGVDLLTYLKENAPDGKLQYIKGETEYIFGFGNKIG